MDTATPSSSSSLSEPFKIRTNGGSFEIYKIEVLHVTSNRKFKEIKLGNGGQFMFDIETIYKREEDEDLPMNQPLSLSGYEPNGAFDNFWFCIGEQEWQWNGVVGIWRDSPWGEPISLDIKDGETGSCVHVCCEWVHPSTLAQIRVLFLDEEVKVKIIRGEILASTVYKKKARVERKRAERKQILRCIPGEIVSLDRSVVALPPSAILKLDVDLTYSVEASGEERIMSYTKSGNIDVQIDDGTYDVEFEPESGVSPVVKVEFCMLGLFGRPRYRKPKSPEVKPERRVYREPEVVGLEDLEEIDSSLKSLFDD